MAKRTKRQQSAAKRLQRYRKLYAQAKRKGLVKGDKRAQSLQPSRYMRGKLNALEPYLGSDYAALPASRAVLKAFKEAPSDVVPKIVNKRLLVKKAPGQRISTKGGILSIRTPLKAGEFEELPLPVSAHNLADFRKWINTNPYYNSILKHSDEVFNFRIFGNDSYNSFGNIEALLNELERYDNYEGDDWEEGEEFFSHFQLFRSYKDWTASEHGEAKRKHVQKRRQEHRERKVRRMSPERRAAYDERQRELRAARRASQPGYQRQKAAQKKKRKDETPAQREARLAKQRAWMKKYRAKKDT